MNEPAPVFLLILFLLITNKKNEKSYNHIVCFADVFLCC